MSPQLVPAEGLGWPVIEARLLTDGEQLKLKQSDTLTIGFDY
jgi:hypothetical protein